MTAHKADKSRAPARGASKAGRDGRAGAARSGASRVPADGTARRSKHAKSVGEDAGGPVPAVTSRRDEAKALFHNAIVDAAEEIFAQQGFHGTRIQDIAERARIAVGTVYNHFGQKEDVLRELIETRFADLVDALSARPDDPAPYDARVRARVARLFDVSSRHKSFFVLTHELGLMGGKTATSTVVQILGPAPLRAVERFRAAMRAMVQEGIAGGHLAEHDVELLVHLMGGVLRAVRQTQRPGTSNADDAELAISLFLQGARKRGRS